MKRFVKILVVAATIAFTTTACQKEEKLIPTFPSSLSKHVIDENGEYYEQISRVLNSYGTLLVYDKFTQRDIANLANSVAPAKHNAKYANKEQLEYILDYVSNNLFNEDYLPSKYGAFSFKPYTYLCYDLNISSWLISPKSLESEGRDFWIIAPQGGVYFMFENERKVFPSTKAEMLKHRGLMLNSALSGLIARDVIKAPKFLQSTLNGGEIEFNSKENPLTTGWVNRNDASFYMARGCVGFYNPSGGILTSANSANGFKTVNQVFMGYLMMAMLWTPEEISGQYATGFEGELIYSSIEVGGNNVYHKDYPIIVDLYNRTVKYMQETYGWDITKSGRDKYNPIPTPPALDPAPETLGPNIPA